MPLYTGNIKFTATDTEPTSDKGNVYYDASEAQLKHYDGDNWVNVNTRTNVDRPGDGKYTSDIYTKLLIHSDNADNNTDFIDSGNSGHTIIRNNDVVHDTAQKMSKLGGSSLYFDGTNDCYLTVEGSENHTDFDIGTQVYTIDCWAKENGSSYWGAMIDHRDRTTLDGMGQFAVANSTGNFRLHNTHCTAGNTTDVTSGAWFHLAFVRSGETGKTYINGVLNDSATYSSSASVDNDCHVRIGASDYGLGPQTDEPYKGWIHEPRISVGVARWTANFPVYT